MTDLQRALAILDEAIQNEKEAAHYAASQRHHDAHSFAAAALIAAHSRLSALATTTHGEQG